MRDLHVPLPLQQHWTFNSLSLHSFLMNSPPSIEIRAWRVSAPCVDCSSFCSVSLTACLLRNLTRPFVVATRPSLLQPRQLLLQPPQLQLLLQLQVQRPEKSGRLVDTIFWRAEKQSNTDLTVAGCRLTCNLSAGAAPGVDTGAVGKPKDCSTSLRVC